MGPDRQRLVRLAVLGAMLEPRAAMDLLARAKERLRQLEARDPMDALVAAVLVGGLLFYIAERGRNPKVSTLYDALVHVSTNLSAGAPEFYAQTPLGKMIATAALTWGPSMKAAAFEPPAARARSVRDAHESLELQRRTLEKLEDILAELRAGRA